MAGHGLGSPYWMFPFVIYAAVRFQQPITSLLLVNVTILADWGTVHGLGPFTLLPLGSRLVPLQIFLGILVLAGLFLSAGVSERTLAERIQAAELAITRTLAGSASLEIAAPKIIRAVCATLEWDIGSLWLVSPDGAHMRHVGVWSMPGRSLPAFEAATRNTRVERGRGLPGRVWESGRSAFITDISTNSNFPRGPVAMSRGAPRSVRISDRPRR